MYAVGLAIYPGPPRVCGCLYSDECHCLTSGYAIEQQWKTLTLNLLVKVRSKYDFPSGIHTALKMLRKRTRTMHSVEDLTDFTLISLLGLFDLQTYNLKVHRGDEVRELEMEKWYHDDFGPLEEDYKVSIFYSASSQFKRTDIYFPKEYLKDYDKNNHSYLGKFTLKQVSGPIYTLTIPFELNTVLDINKYLATIY